MQVRVFVCGGHEQPCQLQRSRACIAANHLIIQQFETMSIRVSGLILWHIWYSPAPTTSAYLTASIHM